MNYQKIKLRAAALLAVLSLALAAPADAQDGAADSTTITAIQTLLNQRGYVAGPADGRLGRRTVAAIQAYQRAIGAPPDGRPSAGLLQRLTREAAARIATAAARAPAGQIKPDVALIDTEWEFVDAGGSVFTARFEPNGVIRGPGEARFWRWELTDAGIRIVYDNEIGTRIERLGRFVDSKWMNGTARTSLGRHWDWVANRIEN